jgi:hypothetical protein
MATGQLNGLVRQIRRLTMGNDAAGMTDRELLKRFVSQRDEAAFAALVRRYGPLVLGVCRRVLHHRQGRAGCHRSANPRRPTSGPCQTTAAEGKKGRSTAEKCGQISCRNMA